MNIKFIIAEKKETSYQLINSMINKMVDEDDVLYCSYACAHVDPVLTSQSYHMSQRISTRRMNMSVLPVLMLMLMSPVFSLAYTCDFCLCLCLRLYAGENQA